MSETAKTDAVPASGQPEAEGPDPRAHYVELDSLRGVAIIAVVACHITARWNNNDLGGPLSLPFFRVNVLEILQFGSYGVSLFFLLSGYLLAWTEGARAKKARGTGYSLGSYAARRALRLVPAYYVSILVVVLLWPDRASNDSLASVVWHASFLHSFSFDYGRTLDGVYWSLTAEAVFYLLLPLMVLKLRGLPARLAVFALLLVVSLGTRIYMTRAGFAPPDPYPTDEGFRFLYYLPSTHLWLFLAGMLLRTLVEGLTPLRDRTTRIALGLFAGSVALLTLFPYLIAPHGWALQGPLSMLVDLAVISFFAAALLGSPFLKGLLRWKPLAGIGAISYSLFLLHNTVLVFFVIYLGRHVVAFRRALEGVLTPAVSAWISFSLFALCVFGLACAVSYLSYRFVETPFLKRKPG